MIHVRIWFLLNNLRTISFAVTTKLISAFVFATEIVQSLFFLNPKFQGSSHLLWLYSPVCVRPGQKPRSPVFSQRGSNQNLYISSSVIMAEVYSVFSYYLEFSLQTKLTTLDLASNRISRIQNVGHLTELQEFWVCCFMNHIIRVLRKPDFCIMS